MNLSEEMIHLLEAHTASSPGSEVCGWIYPDRYLPLRNTASAPDRFIADPRDLARALLRYGEPLAIFHSHPNGNLNPSLLDQRPCYYKNSMMIIGGYVDGEFCVNLVQFPVYGHEGY